ncbi:unnamed protein product [Didymodactylos carnosus]|uniref:Uncharacterized protein n=1 Tax=Didymodactylos carnosus TaxID=1234261 RepID=A0A816CSS1_9BILA|nr:unnamed protein product [Didymodactylos carnosus]CAF4518349.1 unnamed protein product [Didymodactylos carnosus]
MKKQAAEADILKDVFDTVQDLSSIPDGQLTADEKLVFEKQTESIVERHALVQPTVVLTETKAADPFQPMLSSPPALESSHHVLAPSTPQLSHHVF